MPPSWPAPPPGPSAAPPPGRARRGVHDARKQAHGGGLARSVRPHQAENFAFFDGERQTVHRFHVPERLAQPLGLDGFHQSVPRPTRISASTGMPGFSSMLGLRTSILTRYTSFTRSFSVCTFLGVNSACEAMKETQPSYFFP